MSAVNNSLPPSPEAMSIDPELITEVGVADPQLPTVEEVNPTLQRIPKRPRDMRNYNVLKRVHDEIVREQAEKRLGQLEAGSALAAQIDLLTQGIGIQDSKTFEEAMECEDASKWKTAINHEIDSLLENKTWIGVVGESSSELSSATPIDSR